MSKRVSGRICGGISNSSGISGKDKFSRRDFVRSGVLVGAGLAASNELLAAVAEESESPVDGTSASGASPEEGSLIRLGVASYTFRNFDRAQMIGFLKQLDVLEL